MERQPKDVDHRGSALVVNSRSACYLNVWKMMIVGRMSAVVYLMVGALLGWTASMITWKRCARETRHHAGSHAMRGGRKWAEGGHSGHKGIPIEKD